MPGRWITPDAIAGGSDDILLTIPRGSRNYEILRGILLELSDPENWQQIEGVCVCAAADEWLMVAFQDFRYPPPCPDCPDCPETGET